jgi:DNA-binding Lrp family transcriptional regulator
MRLMHIPTKFDVKLYYCPDPSYKYGRFPWRSIYLILRRKNTARRQSKGSKYSMGKVNDKTEEVELLRVDDKDIKIISSLISGYNNQQTSSELQIPLSTIQRRIRIILQSGLLEHNFKPNYRRLGLKKGMIHTYLRNGDMKSTAEKISGMEGITSVSIHIGNSDIVADFVYRDSEQIVDIVSSIKRLEGVEKAVWSEEVYALPMNQKNLSVPFQRLIKGEGV